MAIVLSGFHHLIHKTEQGLHKGTTMNGIYSRLGWSLMEIYFCPFAPPHSCENIRNAVHFTVKFCDGALEKSQYFPQELGWVGRASQRLIYFTVLRIDAC